MMIKRDRSFFCWVDVTIDRNQYHYVTKHLLVRSHPPIHISKKMNFDKTIISAIFIAFLLAVPALAQESADLPSEIVDTPSEPSPEPQPDPSPEPPISPPEDGSSVAEQSPVPVPVPSSPSP